MRRIVDFIFQMIGLCTLIVLGFFVFRYLDRLPLVSDPPPVVQVAPGGTD